MRTTIITLVALALSATTAGGQAQRTAWKPELRPFVGTSIPTGGLRDVVGTETLYGVQLAAELRPWMHVVGTLGWAPGETRYVTTRNGLDVLQYDVGVEVDATQPMWFGLQMHPFWGLGAGARSYRYESSQLTNRTCASGYATTGIEVQAGRTAARIEARDNVLCYRSPLKSASSGTRNDLNFTLGLAYHFR